MDGYLTDYEIEELQRLGPDKIDEKWAQAIFDMATSRTEEWAKIESERIFRKILDNQTKVGVQTAWANGQVVSSQEFLDSLVDGDLIELEDGSEAYYCDTVGPFHRIYTIKGGSMHYTTVHGHEIVSVLEKVRPGNGKLPWGQSLVDSLRKTPKCNCGGKICGVPCRDYCWLESGVP